MCFGERTRAMRNGEAQASHFLASRSGRGVIVHNDAKTREVDERCTRKLCDHSIVICEGTDLWDIISQCNKRTDAMNASIYAHPAIQRRRNNQSNSTTMFSPSKADLNLLATVLPAFFLVEPRVVAPTFSCAASTPRTVLVHAYPSSFCCAASAAPLYSISRMRFFGRCCACSSRRARSLASCSQRLRISSSLLFSMLWKDAWWPQPSHS